MASLIAAGLRRPDQAAAKVKKTATQKVAVFHSVGVGFFRRIVGRVAGVALEVLLFA